MNEPFEFSEALISDILALPLEPLLPLRGDGRASITYPHLRTFKLKKLWAGIPAAHKHLAPTGQRTISVEAHNVLLKHRMIP
jgi:hypothetical protein